MNENTSTQNPTSEKPVNINISFNISRKQVTQNINALDHQKSFNFKNAAIQQNLSSNKPKINTSRPLKTPELPQTDRHIYSKDLQYARATEELKRKKRRKRNSVDYTIDKTNCFPFYPLDLDKSLPTHKRGYTTTTMKKNQSNTKSKKQNSKYEQIPKQPHTIPVSSILNQVNKSEMKTAKMQKNLKNILKKLINNQLSKRSLPLPSVPSKSKYNQSTALTARKMSSARPSKKRSSKSHMIPKQKQVQSSTYLKSVAPQFQFFQNPKILQRLGNFKSIQNSLLVTEEDQNEDIEQRSSRQRRQYPKRIVIKTDQSIQCIGEIHDWEKNFYRDEFFQSNKKHLPHGDVRKAKGRQESSESSYNTLSLIDNYVKLLNSKDEQSSRSDRIADNRYQIPHNVNEKVEIYQQQGDVDFQDESNVKIYYEKDFRRSQGNKQQKKEENLQYDSQQDEGDGQIESDSASQEGEYQSSIKKEPESAQREDVLFQNNQQQQKQQHSESEDDHFRPFISSQMGRQVQSRQPSTNQERARLNELKKHEIEKWSCLLEYIKSNMNSEISTQEVLEQVYDYLSKAKVDLIREGKNLGKEKARIMTQKFEDRLEEEFTNKLSSQILRSDEKNEEKNKLWIFQKKESSEEDHFEEQQNLSMSQMKSQEQQILDEEAKSFKEDYESSLEEQSLKFMNLSTIQSALKNRLIQLGTKKQRQIQNLDELLEQQKITKEAYDLQKKEIQKLYKNEMNEILIVKKNIWKGYNEAKGILDKSYINSRVEEEFGDALYNRFSSNRKSQKKDRRMMKCLSETYLSKKKIDYKKFIEDEEKKKEGNQQNLFQRQPGKSQHSEQDEDDEYYETSKDQEDDQSSHQYHQHDVFDSRMIENYDESNSRIQSSQLSDSVDNHEQKPQSSLRKLQSVKSNSLDDEFEKINQKLNKLKEQHEEQEQKNPQSSSATSQERQSFSITKVNRFSIEGQKRTSSHLLSASPESSNQYEEEIEKSFHTSSQGQRNFEHDEQSLGESKSDYYSQDEINDDSKEYEKDIKHSSDEQQKDDYGSEGQYSQQEQSIINEQLHNNASLAKSKSTSPLHTSVQESTQKNADEPIKKPGLSETGDVVVNKSSQQQDAKIKALQKKFRYLTEEDREDIFQFLFLDLCIELYQQPCHDNLLMDTINRYVAKQYELAKRKKGVKTNLNVVKDYLKRFCGYLLRTNKQVLQNINVPMGPTAIEMLKYMHENEEFEEQAADQSEGVVTLIVPVSIFDTFQRSLLPTLEFEKYYDNQEKQHERVNFLKNILHIHNKALFDALNEFLDQQRPFGIWGKPFPWKKSSSFTHKFTEEEQQQKLKKSAQKVVEACSYVCGLLVDKQQSLVGSSKISEGYIQQIREDRISRMLANEMIQSEERWVFYDDEQTQVLVEASNFVYNNIVKEMMEELGCFMKRTQQAE